MARKSLERYREKRSFEKTPEPKGRKAARPRGNRFAIQEHHARRLHWDLRLEHDGVALSWALPRGVPQDPERNHLAVHTEDHPLEYLEFQGTIPEGQYGAGEISVWDSGTYEAEKLTDTKIILTFHGERVEGRYALFQTNEDNWMIHRMDPPADPEHEDMPERVSPMLATLSKLPRDDRKWAYEIKWDGVRAIAYCEDGHLRLESRNLRDITSQYPEIRKLGEALGARSAVLDGEIVAFDDEGRPDFQRLQSRMHLASESAVRRRMADVPVTYVLFDVLYLDGRSLMGLPYEDRRAVLDDLGLDGPSWQTPSSHVGDGEQLLAGSRQRGLEGIVAKRLDSPYRPGRRSSAWRKVKNTRSQELVVGGWLPGQGSREGKLGALLVGYHTDDGELRYAGRVGTGYTEETLRILGERLEALRRRTSPFDGRQPPKGSIFVEPRLVAEVEFREWTQTRTLRAPSFKGLRDEVDPSEVHLELEEKLQ